MQNLDFFFPLSESMSLNNNEKYRQIERKETRKSKGAE